MPPDSGPDRQSIGAEAVMAKGVEQTGVPATREQTIARSMRVKLDEGGDPREALKIATTPEVSSRDIGAKIEQIGVARDADGKKLRTDVKEKERYDNATTAAELAQRFVSQGYDKLTTQEKTKLGETVVDQINKSPLLAKKYNGMSVPDRDKYVLALLKDPRYTGDIRTILEEITKAPELPDTVLDAQDKLAETTLDRDAKQREVDDITKRVKAVDAKLKEFANPHKVGSKAETLANLTGDLNNILTRLKSANATLEEKKQALADAEADRAASRMRGTGVGSAVDIKEAQRLAREDVARAQKAVDDEQANINKIALLEEEQRSLEEQKKDLGVEQRERELELGKVNLELAKRQRDYQNALSLRTSQETDLVEGFEGVFQEAAIRELNSRVDETADQMDAAIEEWKNIATTQTEKAVLEKIESMYKLVIRKRRWGKDVVERKLNKDAINSDKNLLLNLGPEAYMRSVLVRTINPETRAVYTPDEITKILQDKELVGRLQPKMIEPLLSKAMMVGSLSEADLYLVSTTEWGVNTIDNALATNRAFRDNVAKYGGEGIIDQPGFRERFKNELGSKNLLAFLLTGIIGLPVIAAIQAARESGRIYK